MQPTDFRVRSVFVSLGTKAARRNERGTDQVLQGLVAGREDQPMKDRLIRVMAALTTVAALALAGGASLRGF